MKHATPLRILGVLVPLLMGARVASAAPAPPSPAGPPPGQVLTGDFVELGLIGAGVTKSLAMVTLFNDTPVTLDVALGDGTATLKPGEKLIVRAQPGTSTVKASVPGSTDDRLEGSLAIERGLRYGITFAYALPEEADDEAALEPPSAGGEGAKAAMTTSPPTAAGSSASAASKAAPPATTDASNDTKSQHATKSSQPRTKKNGRVDVGRKRPSER